MAKVEWKEKVTSTTHVNLFRITDLQSIINSLFIFKSAFINLCNCVYYVINARLLILLILIYEV